ncbi:MAG: helix-turn-helix domain-containing protein [Deltaproteobacteria bacterium]|nr:helix-turn-helix domain-containing protein [Deltaproteobacteria bacterium]
MVSQKKLPAFRVGNQWRFKKKILDRWLQVNMNTSPSGKPQ